MLKGAELGNRSMVSWRGVKCWSSEGSEFMSWTAVQTRMALLLCVMQAEQMVATIFPSKTYWMRLESGGGGAVKGEI